MTDHHVYVSIDAINDALDTVADPCAVGVGVPMSIRQMGLVRRVGVTEDGIVEIHLRMTSPGCHMGALVFEPAIREAVEAIDGVIEVRIEFLEALGWTEADIAPEMRAKLIELRTARSQR